MAILRFTLSIIASMMMTAQVAFAQDAPAQAARQSRAVVTAAANDAGGVRFAAPGAEARRVRLEIYGAAGERLFDSGFRPGSIIDWKPADLKQPVADGSYLSVLTIEDMRGAHGRRFGAVSVRSGQVAPRAVAPEQLKNEYAQAVAATGPTPAAFE